ncbi:hypothetical protein TNCV_2308001 [Trichonephila clavipes]|nr:hypothetical protein TNCV_2308001 [Trichonephila clavipes]
MCHGRKRVPGSLHMKMRVLSLSGLSLDSFVTRKVSIDHVSIGNIDVSNTNVHTFSMTWAGRKCLVDSHKDYVRTAFDARLTLTPTFRGLQRELKGYVNKQNCRICSEANPQVYVETPLHPEKLTVWCALWDGGFLLQKRRRPQRCSQW